MFETIDSQVVFHGRVLTVRRDQVQMPDGTAFREVVAHPGAVAVVALDNDMHVVLVRQYRYPVRRELTELPAGLLDVEGEPALTGAQRELFEETALRAERWHTLVDLYTSPGMTDEAVRIYLARDLSPATAPFIRQHEEIGMTVERRPLQDVVIDIFAGQVENGIAVAGLLAAAHAHRTGFASLRPADAPWAAKPDHGGS